MPGIMQIDQAALRSAVDQLKVAAEKLPLTTGMLRSQLAAQTFPLELMRQVPCGRTHLTIVLSHWLLDESRYSLTLSCSLQNMQPVPHHVVRTLIDLVFDGQRPTPAATNDPSILSFFIEKPTG